MTELTLTSPKAEPKRTALGLYALAIVWGLTCLAGIIQVTKYKFAVGQMGVAAMSWPSESRLARDSNRPSFVLFAHPHCVCTKASLEEFARIMTHRSGRLSATVVVDVSDATVADSTESEVWQYASRIPGVQVIPDRTGQESAAFGAMTSGHALLYSADGKLLFSGGITAFRGHAGDNLGRTRIENLLRNGNVATPSNHAVYGCPLSKNNRCCRVARESVQ